MPVFKIHHITKYEYDRPVVESVNEIRIYPYIGADQETLSHDILITGSPDVFTFSDYWSNKTGLFNLLSLHKELVIESKLILRTTASPEVKVNFETGFEELKNDMAGDLRLIELAETPVIKNQFAVDEIIQSITQNTNSVASIVQNCSEYIFKKFKYIKGITTIETTVDEIFEHRAGVCQDFANVMLQVKAQHMHGLKCIYQNMDGQVLIQPIMFGLPTITLNLQ